jgi:hypothetical protein
MLSFLPNFRIQLCKYIRNYYFKILETEISQNPLNSDRDETLQQERGK